VTPSPTTPNQAIAVFGASGHTDRFVVSELRRRGWTLILSGRDAEKLNAVRDEHPGAEVRSARVDAPAALDRAFLGASAVINCAGPFIDTAAPVMEAAIRARIHYLDVTAEQPATLAACERFTDAARNAGIVIAPAMAFYGGLGDLLATVATGDWQSVDEVRVAVALDSWKPTPGTRLTGQRNPGRRLVFSKGRLQHLGDPPPTRTWSFPAPFGDLEVLARPFTEIITISRHLPTLEVHAYMNLAPLRDLHDPDTSAPTATGEWALGSALSHGRDRSQRTRGASRHSPRPRHLRDQRPNRRGGGYTHPRRSHRENRSRHCRGTLRRAQLPGGTLQRVPLGRRPLTPHVELARAVARRRRAHSGSRLRFNSCCEQGCCRSGDWDGGD
jgi:Saccharopine dehydrogenase NADP binding domain